MKKSVRMPKKMEINYSPKPTPMSSETAPSSMVFTRAGDNKILNIRFYKHTVTIIDRTRVHWIASCDDMMGGMGPGLSWMEALQNCLAAVRDIEEGKVPCWIQQEIDRVRKRQNVG